MSRQTNVTAQREVIKKNFKFIILSLIKNFITKYSIKYLRNNIALINIVKSLLISSFRK